MIARGPDFDWRLTVFERVVHQIRHQAFEQRARHHELRPRLQIAGEQCAVHRADHRETVAQKAIHRDDLLGTVAASRDFQQLLRDVGKRIDVFDKRHALVPLVDLERAGAQTCRLVFHMLGEAGQGRGLCLERLIATPRHLVESPHHPAQFARALFANGRSNAATTRCLARRMRDTAQRTRQAPEAEERKREDHHGQRPLRKSEARIQRQGLNLVEP